MDTSLNSFKLLSRSSVSPSMPVVSSQLLKTFWSLRHVLNTHIHTNTDWFHFISENISLGAVFFFFLCEAEDMLNPFC